MKQANPYEEHARSLKVAALADVLWAAGATAEALRCLANEDWLLAAQQACVKAPSEATKAAVIVAIGRREVLRNQANRSAAAAAAAAAAEAA